MFLSTPVKILGLTCLLLTGFSGCSLWRGNENSQVSFASPIRNGLPFTSREPEVFQTEILVRAGDSERRMIIAKDGEKRRTDFDVGTDEHRAVLLTDNNQYLLYFKRGTYTERTAGSDLASAYQPLTAQLLNTRDNAEFEEFGRNGQIVEYHGRVNGSPVSEVVIFFDEAIGLPVKQEIYGIEGETRTLQYSVELRDFRTTVDDGMFEIPKGFKKSVGAK